MRVHVGDVRLYFDVEGMGLVASGPIMRERPTVVCLHGGPGPDHTMLKPYLAPLADSAQVVFVDQRGHGRSDRSSPDKWNLDTWIADVADFCKVRSRSRHRSCSVSRLAEWLPSGSRSAIPNRPRS